MKNNLVLKLLQVQYVFQIINKVLKGQKSSRAISTTGRYHRLTFPAVQTCLKLAVSGTKGRKDGPQVRKKKGWTGEIVFDVGNPRYSDFRDNQVAKQNCFLVKLVCCK